MNSVKLVITALIIFLVGACTQNKLAKDPNLYAVPVNNFSKSVELLISNADFLEEEFIQKDKINRRENRLVRLCLCLRAHKLLLRISLYCSLEPKHRRRHHRRWQ